MYKVNGIDASAKAEFNARRISQRLSYLNLVVDVDVVKWATQLQITAICLAMKSPDHLSYAVVPDEEVAAFKAFVRESKCVVVTEFGVSEHETMLFVVRK
jgi:hypothetical protein